MAMTQVLAVYRWHPYEFRALLIGIGAGLFFGIQIGRMFVYWSHRRRVRAALSRAQTKSTRRRAQ
jgi:hypothetical protein